MENSNSSDATYGEGFKSPVTVHDTYYLVDATGRTICQGRSSDMLMLAGFVNQSIPSATEQITQAAGESADAIAPRSQRGNGMATEVATASGMESSREGGRPSPHSFSDKSSADTSGMSMEEVCRKALEIRSCLVDIYGTPPLLLDALAKLEVRFQELKALPSSTASTPDDDEWGMGPDGHHAVIAYINNTPDLFALFLELHMLGHIENCDPTSDAFDTIYTIANHWRESMAVLVDQRGNLAMLVRTLVHALRRHDKASGPADRAMAYLCSKGLQGSILRDAHDDIQQS